MPEIEKILQDSELQNRYAELNEAKKEDLRLNFLTSFDYASKDTFYRKLSQKTPVRNHEKKWFAEKFKTTVEKLFPEKEQEEQKWTG